MPGVRGKPTINSASILDLRLLRLIQQRPGLYVKDIASTLSVNAAHIERRLQVLHAFDLLTYFVTAKPTKAGTALLNQIETALGTDYGTP